jgi:hypothetical protein
MWEVPRGAAPRRVQDPNCIADLEGGNDPDTARDPAPNRVGQTSAWSIPRELIVFPFVVALRGRCPTLRRPL